MSTICLTAVVLCLGISLVPSLQQEVECPTSERGDPIKVSISGRRNQTGHWFTQVSVEHKTVVQEQNHQSSQEWNVDVEYTSTVCNDIELTNKVVLTFPAAPLPEPPVPGYKLLPGFGYYKLDNRTASWSGALQLCANEGGHLVVIHSEREAAAINKTLLSYDSSIGGQVWVGIYEQGADGKYLTVFGEPANANSTGYFTWAPGEPNDKTVGNCVLLSFHVTFGYGYNDYLCATSQKFICKLGNK